MIPDETPVEITYSVTVNIAPNQKVALQNSVHWKSYSTNGGTTNKIEEFSYKLSAGGSSGTTSHPNLTIKRLIKIIQAINWTELNLKFLNVN